MCRRAVLGGAQAHAVQHLGVQLQHVPVEGVEQQHGPVGETVYHLEAEPIAQQADDGPAAFGAEIEGEEVGRHTLTTT